MKRILIFTAIAAILFIIIILINFSNGFPVNSDRLVFEKYSGWSGVVRIWLCSGWAGNDPGLTGWLNRCGSSYEKNNDGVYIQIQPVDETVLAGICENGIIPPDLIIFPPEVLSDPKHLLPIEPAGTVRASLSSCGLYRGVDYACPILVSGYAWAYNTELLNGIPETWADSGAAISVFPDNEHLKWSAALMSLCSGRYIPDNPSSTEKSLSFDLDLGLSLSDALPEPSATPEPQKGQYGYCALPTNISFTENAFDDFAAGRTAAMPVSRKHIMKLQALSDQGKGPAWEIACTGDILFTDQVLYAGIVDRDMPAEKQTVCADFISHLLSDPCQNDIHRASAFSVTAELSGYNSYDPMSIIDNALRADHICVSPAFDTGFENSIDSIIRIFMEYRTFTPEIYCALSEPS